MSKKKRAAIWVVALSIICGLITWHAVHWHLTGMYQEMFNWVETGRSYITVLYNLGLMLVMGTALGHLMKNITEVLSDAIHTIRSFDDEAEVNKSQ